MKILLDECLPVDFRHSFPGHEAHSVEWAGLKGKKNGELLQAAEGGDYQGAADSRPGHPSSAETMVGQKLSVILIRSRTNRMEDRLPPAPAIIKVLEFIQPGQSVLIPFSG